MRSVVLGPYFFSPGAGAFIPRGSKTSFQRGDVIIAMDSRVTIGRGTVEGDIPYQLDDANRSITRGTVRLQPAEFPIIRVNVAKPTSVEPYSELPEQWATIIPIEFDGPAALDVEIEYQDPDGAGEGGQRVTIETVKVSGLATVDATPINAFPPVILDPNAPIDPPAEDASVDPPAIPDDAELTGITLTGPNEMGVYQGSDGNQYRKVF